MREITLPPCQHPSPDAVVTARDYADGALFPTHDHSRGQFACAAKGVITDEGNWVVPPERGMQVNRYNCTLRNATRENH